MNTTSLDNSITEEMRQVITWQYDNAPNLIQLVNLIRSMYTQSTAAMWNSFVKWTNVGGTKQTTGSTTPDGWNEYGIALWGKILNIPRPILSYGSPAADHVLGSENYRNLIVARLRLLNSNGSISDYLTYLKFIYGNYVKVEENQSQDGVMSLKFTVASGLSDELSALCSQYPDVAFVLPAGVRSNGWTGNVLGLDGQQNNTTSTDPTIGRLYDPNVTGSASVASCFYWRKKISNPKGSGEIWTD